MVNIKKISSNPPARLQDKIIELSVSKSFEIAKKEWKLKRFYYVREYKSCLCSPRGMHNICILVNVFNSNELEICNSCASCYFGLQNGNELDYCITKLKANIEYNMGKFPLEYLVDNKIINKEELINYEIIRGVRDNEYILSFRRETNKKMLLFTDYSNKAIFDKIERILIWSIEQPPQYLSDILHRRNQLINTGSTNVGYLDDLIAQKRIGTYSAEKVNYAIGSLDLGLKAKYLALPWEYRYLEKRRPVLKWPIFDENECNERKENNETQVEGFWWLNDSQDFHVATDWTEKEEEKSDLELALLEALATPQQHARFYGVIYKWITCLIKTKRHDNGEVYSLSDCDCSRISMCDILDFLNIPELFEAYQEHRPNSILELLVECDLTVMYTCDVITILINKSDDELRKEYIIKINTLIRKEGVKILYKNSVTSFVLSKNK